jgi:serine/threonine-protein kinase
MAAHLALAPPPPTDLNPFLPPALCAIILKAIEKRPDDRFQTAADFRAKLESLMSGVTPGAGQPAVAPAPGPDVPARGATPPSGTAAWSPGVLEATVKDLAVYIGPMAKIIVNRAAKQAQTPRQLYETVAAEIASPADRAKFLAKRGA